MASVFLILYVASMALKVLVFLVYLVWRRALYILSFKLPGPMQLPVLGNLQSLIFKKGTLFERINATILSNKATFRFWIGHKLFVVTRDPATVEKILTSQLLLQSTKTGINTDERWRQHKKQIKPMINVKFIIDNLDTIQKQTNLLLGNLEKHLDEEECFDIYNYIHPCTTDIIGDIFLGDTIDSQLGKNAEFLKANAALYENENKKRLFTWLNLSLIYKCTSYYKSYKTAKQTQRYFIENLIRKSWERRKMDVFGENNTSSEYKSIPLIDKVADVIESNPKTFENEEFRDYLLDIFLESENAISIITSFACVCFGMYPEFQRKAVSEIQSVLGKNFATLKNDDLYKLKYLDMCVQDVIRLVALKPLIFRNFTTDLEIDGLKIPPECTIVIPMNIIHRDKNEYERPDHFNPNHFLPDNIKKRNTAANLNFGMGPRECMGKLLATMTIKTILCYILQSYRIEAEGVFTDLELRSDVYVKPVDGFKVRVKKRAWDEV